MILALAARRLRLDVRCITALLSSHRVAAWRDRRTATPEPRAQNICAQVIGFNPRRRHLSI